MTKSVKRSGLGEVPLTYDPPVAADATPDSCLARQAVVAVSTALMVKSVA